MRSNFIGIIVVFAQSSKKNKEFSEQDRPMMETGIVGS